MNERLSRLLSPQNLTPEEQQRNRIKLLILIVFFSFFTMFLIYLFLEGKVETY